MLNASFFVQQVTYKKASAKCKLLSLVLLHAHFD